MIFEDIPFSAGVLRRDAHLRPNADQLWQDEKARVLPLSKGRVLVADTGGLHLIRTGDLAGDAAISGQDTRVFLGLDTEGHPLFAAHLSNWDVKDIEEGGFLAARAKSPHAPDAYFSDLRAVMTDLTPWEAEVAATARALLSWHARHGFCSNCGVKTSLSDGGWHAHCDACGTSHFPRTDPVVIMLVTHGNKVLLGRSPGWPEGMYSLLAGFVEPGEPIEAAVRREVFEEAGVEVDDIRYIANQPWPFPASLMIGFSARARSTDIVRDEKELEDAIWLNREALLRVSAGQHPSILPSRKGSIAHSILTKWLADLVN